MHNSLCVSENKTETQRGLVTCPRLHSKWGMEPVSGASSFYSSKVISDSCLENENGAIMKFAM